MTPAKLEERRKRFAKLDRALKKLFPNVGTELVYKTPWQFMVAVQLSAQCTDKRVNIVTKELFKTYKTIDDYARADPRAFEKAIGSVTYYHNKARNIINAAKFVKREFGGKLPKTMGEMVTIPGVGRKTANVILADIYGITPGITVDTHVIRFVSRFDLSDHRDAVRIERDLMQIVPEKEWRLFTHRVIHYGRYLAPARAYDLSKDPLVKIYPPAAKKFRV
ncbi:MAG TPA: endonuclease III [Candidatus Paceibacterota bacterium]|nr:endonuclease III [Candidatus Paceibacterota bacterium]